MKRVHNDIELSTFNDNIEWNPFMPSVCYYNQSDDLYHLGIKKFYNGFEYDRNTNNLILIIFDGGSGGNFLANCLSFNDRVATTIEDKIQFCKNKMDNIDLIWNDFQINNLLSEDKYFFILDHPLNKNVISEHLKYWKNPNIIYFKNTKLFRKLRRCVWSLAGEEDIIFEIDNLKEKFRTFSEFSKLNNDERTKIIEKYSDKTQLYSQSLISNKKSTYVWDTNWFLSYEDTIDNLQKLYDIFDLGDIDKKSIKEYYTCWMNKIDNLKILNPGRDIK